MDPESCLFGLQSKVHKDEFSVFLNSEQLSSTAVIKYVIVPFSFMKLELLTSSFYFDWR